MKNLAQKTFKTSRGFTYTYYTTPAKDGRPTCYISHGWCDEAAMWNAFANDYLIPNGYGAIIPDCLGYAGTDKPTNWEAYDMKGMVGDAFEICDNEGIEKVVSIGHDWGAALAQRLYNFHPERVSGLILVSVAYIPPGPFKWDEVQEMGKKILGYPQYWYWLFFTAEDGPRIMNENVESMFEAEHGIPETWMDTFCKEDGMRDFVANGKRQEVESYVTPEFRSRWLERVKRDKFDGPNCWYVPCRPTNLRY
jgi:soluble epoxide hydrolase / lipid-phosphate phosphatase